ncbi:MAG: sulfotransferase family protein [Tepidisphaerales bacterium]
MSHHGASEEKDFPVFILGSPRSGTSTLAHVFSEHFGYRGYPEGHVLNLLHRLAADIRTHFVAHGIYEQSRATAAADLSERYRLATTTAQAVGMHELTDAVVELFRRQLRVALGPSWFDKTPGQEAILGADLMRPVYPHARYIFLIRDPVSNIESRMRKFPQVPFHEHCQAWVECANAWLALRAELQPGQYLELRTHELSTEPQRVYASLLELIREHPLGQAAASKPPLTRFLTLERTSSDDPGAVRSLDDVTWTDAQRQTFLAICSGVMDTFGFRAGSDDRRDSTRLLPPPHGQPGVDITKGDYGGVWPQVHNEAMWIFMHPSAEGTTPTTLTYRGISLDGVGRIRSRMTVISELAPTVRFTIEIRAADGGHLLGTRSFDCPPMQERELDLPVPAGVAAFRGAVDLTIRAESAEGRINNAWSLIQPLRLELAPAVEAGAADLSSDETSLTSDAR